MSSFGGETPVDLYNSRIGGAGIASYTVPLGQYAKVKFILSGPNSPSGMFINGLSGGGVESLTEYIFHSGDVLTFGDTSSDKGSIYVTLFNNPS